MLIFYAIVDITRKHIKRCTEKQFVRWKYINYLTHYIFLADCFQSHWKAEMQPQSIQDLYIYTMDAIAIVQGEYPQDNCPIPGIGG